MLASDFETYHNLLVLDVTEQNWMTYPIIWDNHMTGFGKLINLRENLYYFHDVANQDFSNSVGAINRILKNGTRIDLKVNKLFDGSDSNAFIMHHVQLAPFSRRFFENSKTDGLNMKYTKFVWLLISSLISGIYCVSSQLSETRIYPFISCVGVLERVTRTNVCFKIGQIVLQRVTNKKNNYLISKTFWSPFHIGRNQKWMTKNRASSQFHFSVMLKVFLMKKNEKKNANLALEIIKFIRYQIQMDRTERSNFLRGKGWLFIVIQLCYNGFTMHCAYFYWSFHTMNRNNHRYCSTYAQSRVVNGHPLFHALLIILFCSLYSVKSI